MTTSVKLDDFVIITSEEELLAKMDSCLHMRRGIRVIGSGWSFHPIIQADKNSDNIMLKGDLSTTCILDLQLQRATLSGALQITRFLEACKRTDLEWPPKGACFIPAESQTFGGFVANNVHHSYTPTAFPWVVSATVAVYQNSRAVILQVSRDQHSELFESIFGGVGFTCIVLSLELQLRLRTYYDVTSETVEGVTLRRENFKRTLLTVLAKESMICGLTNTGTFRLFHARSVKKGYTMIHHKSEGFSICEMLCASLTFDRYRVMQSYSHQFNRAWTTGTSLSQYDAFSIPWARSNLVPQPLVAGKVAMESILVDIAVLVQRNDYERVLDIMYGCLSPSAPPMFIMARLMPNAGGGIVAANSKSDVVVLEIHYWPTMLSKDANDKHITPWLQLFFESLYDDEIRVHTHTGKGFFAAKAIHDALGANTRMRLKAVKDEYDPGNIFDGGEVKFPQIYNLDHGI